MGRGPVASLSFGRERDRRLYACHGGRHAAWRDLRPQVAARQSRPHPDRTAFLYRGQIDSPKTNQSKRSVALSQGLQTAIARWKRSLAIADLRSGCSPLRRGEPPRKDNCWRRWIAPRLRSVGLEWVNFQVMRSTHASLMRELKVYPKVVADQLGHSLDVVRIPGQGGHDSGIISVSIPE